MIIIFYHLSAHQQPERTGSTQREAQTGNTPPNIAHITVVVLFALFACPSTAALVQYQPRRFSTEDALNSRPYSASNTRKSRPLVTSTGSRSLF